MQGTAIGEKITSGELIGERSVIVYVTEKKSKSSIKSNRVPSSIRLGNDTLSTDVVEIGQLRPQFANPPYYCRDGSRLGTVTSLCRSKNSIFAATCAHNLKGPDLDIYTSDPIELYNPNLQNWVQVGHSHFVQYGNGTGVPGDFGFTDAGLFTINDPTLIHRALKSNRLPTWKSVTSGTEVWCIASSGQTLFGQVLHMEAEFGALYADICILIKPPGTYAGDSGVLWRGKSGIAVAVHAQGSDDYGDGAAIYSFGMFAHRMESVLGVEFLDIRDGPEI